MNRNVICMVEDIGKKVAFVVDGSAQDCISRMLEGILHLPKYVSGFEVVSIWREQLLKEYEETMEDTIGVGRWEYPGYYVPANPNFPRFHKNCYMPDFLLGLWLGNASEIPESE